MKPLILTAFICLLAIPAMADTPVISATPFPTPDLTQLKFICDTWEAIPIAQGEAPGTKGFPPGPIQGNKIIDRIWLTEKGQGRAEILQGDNPSGKLRLPPNTVECPAG